ncbi:hypothetical protein D1872_295790 [compost metagenome]
MKDILDFQHVPGFDHIRPYPVYDQFGRGNMRAFQKPDDPVRIANGRMLRRGHDDGLIRSGDRVPESLFDPGRAVDNYVFVFLF